MTAQLRLFQEALTAATVLKHARQLARVTPERKAAAAPGGVVPINQRTALAWAQRETPELLADEHIVFKLAVRGRGGEVEAVCFGTRPYEADARRAVELTPVAPRGNEAAFQAALRAGADAALAMGFERVHYYRPVDDDPGHPFDAFAPLVARAFKAKRGGGLAWRLDGTGYYLPWLRRASPGRYRELKVDEVMARQYRAILLWQDAEQELLERTDYDPSDDDYARAAADVGIDWDSWRPVEMDRRDAERYVDEATVFERYALAAQPRKAAALFVEALPFGHARDVAAAWHSHLTDPDAVRTHFFSLGVYARAEEGLYPEHLRAVAIVSLPVSAALTQQGPVAEVVRVAVDSGLPPLAGVDARHRGSEASLVLSAVERAALALGFTRVVSSTLLGEKGAGYRAAGWKPVAVSLGGQWGRDERPRGEAEQAGMKIRWETGPGAVDPVTHPEAGTVDDLVKAAAELHRKGLLPLGGVEPPKANDAEAWVRRLFAAEQARFAAVYGPRSLPALAVLHVVDARCPGDKGPCGLRNVAQATWLRAPGGRRSLGSVELARRALALPPATLVAVLRHELGHLADARVDQPGSEARADRIAERVGGQPFYYDARHLQTVDPRAPGARRGRPRHLHQ